MAQANATTREAPQEQVIELADDYRIEIRRHSITIWTPSVVVNLIATLLEPEPGAEPVVAQFVLRTFDGETYTPLVERKTVLVDDERAGSRRAPQ